MSRCLTAAVLLACLSAHARGQDKPINLADPNAKFEVLPDIPSLPTLSDPTAPPSTRFFAQADYLMWWIKPVCLKPFTVLGNNTLDRAGLVAGPNGATVAQGGYKFEFKGLSGTRLNLGMWFDDNHSLGIEGNGFILEQGNAASNFRSVNGSPATAIPYISPTAQKEGIPFSIPGLVNGTSIATGHSWLWGAEANLVASFGLSGEDVSVHADLLLGFRHLHIRDKVDVFNIQQAVGDPTNFATGAANFTTLNRFYGGQVGVRLGIESGRWSLLWAQKIAIGETAQEVQVTGAPLLTSSGNNLFVPGPVIAGPSNVGRQTSSRFTVVPEAALTLRFRWTNHISTSIGYSALYWNKVLCPGDQMDQRLNPTQLPYRGPTTGPRLPAPQFVQTDFFAQGYNVGIEFEY